MWTSLGSERHEEGGHRNLIQILPTAGQDEICDGSWGYSFDPKTKVDDPTAKRMMDAVVDNVKLYHGHGPIDDDNNNAPVLPVPFFRREENEKKAAWSWPLNSRPWLFS